MAAAADLAITLRRPAWKWWVCGLLLLATMLNYMDRLTLNQSAKRIKDEFGLSNKQYGELDQKFSYAFAFGALVLGFVADRCNVRWFYPTAVLAWSLAGFATGFVDSFQTLLLCRIWLGFAEAGHWPCALRTTQRVLGPERRTLGNGILQSGAAVGAVVTPWVVIAFVAWTGTWRYPFMVVGALGLIWVGLWLWVVRPEDLAQPAAKTADAGLVGRAVLAIALDVWAMLKTVWDRRFWVLLLVVWSINITWHYFRVWLPLFLQEYHGYTEGQTQAFTSAYYLATDAGSLCAGFGTLWLVRRGLTVHHSRVAVFGACTLLTTLSLVAVNLSAGPLLLLVLLVIGFAALGLFPVYYSFSQELTVRHQGKVTGLLGFLNWMVVGTFQLWVGSSIDETKSYADGLTMAGLAPLVGLTVLVLFWGRTSARSAVEPDVQKVAPPAKEAHDTPDEAIRADIRGIRKG
jgi:ACS family hexuronate transporter-like MFS transporter